VLSTTLALIPAVLLPNITESRLAVFAGRRDGPAPGMAVGSRGLVATLFALTVSATFHFPASRRRLNFAQPCCGSPGPAVS